MELPHLCREHCVWAWMWHHPVFWNHQGSLGLPLWGKLEGLCGYWTMILSALSWNYSIALCLVWTFSSASSRRGPSTQSLSGESCSSTHSFSDFSIHYLIPAGAGHPIIKEQLLHYKALRVEALTAACPKVRGWAEFWRLGGIKNMGSLYLLNSYNDFYQIWSVWCRANHEAISWRWSWLVNEGVAYYKINYKH